MREYKSSYTYCLTTKNRSVNFYRKRYFDFSKEDIANFVSPILEKAEIKDGKRKVNIGSVSSLANKCYSATWGGVKIYPLASYKNAQILRSMFAILHETKTPVVVNGKSYYVEYDSGIDSKNFCDENNIARLTNSIKKMTNNGIWTRKTDILYVKEV